MFAEENPAMATLTADHDRSTPKVDIFDSHPNNFTSSATRCIHEFDDRFVARSPSSRNQFVDVFFRDYFRQRSPISTATAKTRSHGVHYAAQVEGVKEASEPSQESVRALHRCVASRDIKQKVPHIVMSYSRQWLAADINTELADAPRV